MQHIVLMLPFLVAMSQSPSPDDPLLAEFQKQVAGIEKAIVPDKRVELFEVEAAPSGTRWEVKGNTTVASARDALVKAARSIFGTRLGNIDVRLLPDHALGEKKQALVRVSVAPMRKAPKHAAEMVDQLVMGTPVRLLREEGAWAQIQAPYRYLGWVEKLMLVRQTPGEVDAWMASPTLARFARLHGTIWAGPDQREPVSDIVLSGMVKTGPGSGGLTGVILPDGRTGFVDPLSLLPVNSTLRDRPNPSEIVRLALQLRGIPYLWGGNSTNGFDCSGFTQTVFRMNNLQLPRDADQQARQGIAVDPAPDFSNVQPADLLFFGQDRITHVGISLGGGRFIHESVDVHVTSLDSKDPDFDPNRRETLKQIRRVVGKESVTAPRTQ